MSLFYPRFVVNEYAPVFRLFDELQAVGRATASPSYSRCGGARHHPANQLHRSFQPRFDVKETSEAYELKGELPGIEQKNIEVAFTDEKTLVIKGRTESRREEGTKPAAAVEHTHTQQTAVEATAPTTAAESAAPVPVEDSETGSYHKPSVAAEEDEDFEHVSSSSASDADGDATMSGANPDATPAETPATESAPAPQEVAPTQQQQPRSRYWISERSVGRFSRTFTFPSRIDQEAVSASLKDGILSIVVPKAAAPENRTILIQ